MEPPEKHSRISIEGFSQDLLYTCRKLRREPLFTLTAVITLTLGVGMNAAVFGVLHRLFGSLPVAHPDQFVRITLALSGKEEDRLSGPLFDALRNSRKAIPEAMAWAPFETYLEENGSIQPIDGALISGNGFSLLGLKPELGRLLTEGDDTPGGGPGGFAVVISDRFWRSHLGGSAAALNQKLMINGIPLTFVGVMPAQFKGMMIGSAPDVVMPLEFEVRSSGQFSQRHFAGSTWLSVFGRRNPDVCRSLVRPLNCRHMLPLSCERVCLPFPEPCKASSFPT
jgi:hypothetical protein